MAGGRDVGMVSECRTPHADMTNSINQMSSIIKPFPTRSGDPRKKKEAWSARRGGGKQSDLPRACPCASPARLKPIFAQQRLSHACDARTMRPSGSEPSGPNPSEATCRIKRSLRRTILVRGWEEPRCPRAILRTDVVGSAAIEADLIPSAIGLSDRSPTSDRHRSRNGWGGHVGSVGGLRAEFDRSTP